MNSIELQGVGKRYWKTAGSRTLLRALVPYPRQVRSELWALRDVDLTLAQGDVVGVLGRNGAGKTTMLRMLAGVTRPTQGTVRTLGHVAPLISVGVGFHREMSGRENVYVNGMLLGLTKAEIDRRLDDIITFAELDEFIDTPVKFYSSGMFMRLGFSVAVHTDPDVMLIDEVLAVGDLAFQMKCLERLREIRRAGTTIVIVSHSTALIRLLCPRTIVLKDGRLDFDGDTEGAIARHTELLWEADGPERHLEPGQQLSGGARVVERTLIGPDGPTRTLQRGDPYTVRTRVQFDRPVDSPMVGFTVYAPSGQIAFAIQSPMETEHRSFLAGDEVEVELAFEGRLLGGDYRVTSFVSTRDGRDILLADEVGLVMHVPQVPWAQGVVDLGAVVRVDGQTLVEERTFDLS